MQMSYGKRGIKGFTLVELAIVLVVLGLLVGIGASLMGPLSKQTKVRETQDIVKGAKEAVLGNVVRVGFLPMSTAGARSTDAWGNPLQYVRASEIDAAPEDVCGVPSTALSVQECQDESCTSSIIHNNIGFIIYSQGQDNNGQGTAVPPYRVMVPGSPYIDAGIPYDYDDIVAYVSLDEIRSRRGCGQPLNIGSPATLPVADEDSYYSHSLQATGGRPPYTWTPIAVVNGVSGNSSGLVSGTVNISTTAPNTGELTACSGVKISISTTVTDAAGATASYSGDIPVRPRPLTILTQSLPVAYVGSFYSANVDASGGVTSYGWTVSGLPAGLSLSGSTISGTPSTGGTYTVTATVNDSCGMSQVRSFGLTVNASGGGGGGGSCPALALAPASGTGVNATVGIAFSQTITVSGGEAPYSGCVPSTCNGLSLSCSSPNAVISGTPLTPGTCNFNVGWTDSCTTPVAQNISGTYPVTISGPACSGLGLSGALGVAQNCKPYAGSVNAVGGVANYAWTITPSTLPVTFTTCNGQDSASPSCSITASTPILLAPGSYSFNASVTDSCSTPQTMAQVFSVTVSDPQYATGMTVTNKTNNAAYYSVNGIGCTKVNKNNAMAVANTGDFRFYADAACGTACGPVTDYCGQKSIDTNGNGQTQLTNACAYSDL